MTSVVTGAAGLGQAEGKQDMKAAFGGEVGDAEVDCGEDCDDRDGEDEEREE